MSFRLALQRLPSAADKVLVLGQLAGAHNGEGWFGPSDLETLFQVLRVPAPANCSATLGRLRTAGLVTFRTPRPSWSLTPEGDERVRGLSEQIDAAALAPELSALAGAELGRAVHSLLPPTLAPIKWQAPIQRMLREFDFSTNVFCMTRFPRDEQDTEYLDPVADLIPAAREALRRHGLTLHLASDRQLDDDLYGNIAAHMWACSYGVGLFEDRLDRGLNENMIIEVGSMVMTGRRCALLKDRTIERLPTDFVGHIYKPVDFADVDAVTEQLHRWVVQDIGLSRCSECPPPS